MKTIAILSQKGGVGKTTIAVHLGVAAARRDKVVAIADTDPQTTATTWRDWRGTDDNPAVAATPHKRLPAFKQACEQEDVDFMIIDTPPAADLAPRAAAEIADLILIPTRPAAFDLQAIKASFDMVASINLDRTMAKGLKAIPAFVVLNLVPSRAGQAVEETIQFVTQAGFKVAPVCLVDRAAFRNCVIDGKTAVEIDPLGKASGELDGLYEWMCQQVGVSARRRDHTRRPKNDEVAA